MDATIRRLPRLDRVKLIKSLCIAELVLWVACTAMAGSGGHDTGHGSSHDAGSHAVAATHASAAEKTADTHAAASVHEQERAHEAASHGQESHAGDAGHGQVMLTIAQAPGVATVEAAISNLDYELNERFWGWRPNDIFSLGDNVVNFQLGVLEVTRRTTVNLAERISRTGSTAAFDTNLENAMNWFMIKATDYWLPSAESKYSEGLEALQAFADALNRGEARFHTRTDNLIPLLRDFSDLLGSCDENLVKHYEDDGSHVSAFKADDYFFYAKGVASALRVVLEAIEIDFHKTLEARRGLEVLHHAIESCHHAIEVDPWIVLNASPGSFLANHRANLAAPISHARFYLDVLIQTIST